MAVYTVLEPPLKGEQTQPDPERFAFVRDGFSFWAFLLAPLWMLWHRLWLVLVGYIIVAAALQLGLNAIGASFTVRMFAAALLALLIGLEAATLRRFTLARRRWRNLGIVIGDDLETAERRFFDVWSQEDWATNASIYRAPRASSATSAAPAYQPPTDTLGGAAGIIGLFPQSGAPR